MTRTARLRLWLMGPDRWISRRCRHRVTQPGQREKAIQFWRLCAGAWCATRFGTLEGWKPAEVERRLFAISGARRQQ